MLCMHVLSSSVANALEYFGDPDTTETQTFVRNLDRFFDSFNVRCTQESIRKRKPDLRPYRDPSDSRFTNLVALNYRDEWEKSVKGRKEFTAAQRNMMLLSQQTIEGLRITVHSFIEMSQVLLALPAVNCVLSEKLCQDPVESFFGQQRTHGGRSDNPTVKQFCDKTVSLRAQGSVALESIRGNCGKRVVDTDASVNSTPPPP